MKCNPCARKGSSGRIESSYTGTQVTETHARYSTRYNGARLVGMRVDTAPEATTGHRRATTLIVCSRRRLHHV